MELAGCIGNRAVVVGDRVVVEVSRALRTSAGAPRGLRAVAESGVGLYSRGRGCGGTGGLRCAYV